MNHLKAGEYWNANAEAWTQLSRAGYDVYRDHLNTPAFLASLPDVAGRHGIDLGCGEGHNTRLVAQRGARMTGIDIAEIFIRHAKAKEAIAPLGIEYHTASAIALPFEAATFDFAVAFMSLMDIPETEHAIAEAYRVLRPGGFLKFSILHPCFNPPYRRNCRNEENVTYAVEVGEYFTDARGQLDEWTFGVAPESIRGRFPKFRVPRFHRPVSEWFNFLIAAGFQIERVEEPKPSAEAIARWPLIQDATIVAYFLHLQVRKPTL